MHNPAHLLYCPPHPPPHPGIKWSERKSYCQYIPSARDQPPYNPALEYRDNDCFFSVNDAYITLVVQW